MKRIIDHALKQWKSSSSRKPLILRGARQIGKTTAVRYLGTHFTHFVEINFDVQTDRIVVSAEVEAIWKTGVEMEALCAASVAALTIYDILKPLYKYI